MLTMNVNYLLMIIIDPLHNCLLMGGAHLLHRVRVARVRPAQVEMMGPAVNDWRRQIRSNVLHDATRAPWVEITIREDRI